MIFAFLLLIGHVSAANIFYVNPLPSPSHHIWHLSFIKGLNARGHNVTLMEGIKSLAPPTDLYHPIFYEGAQFQGNFNDLRSYSTSEMLTYYMSKLFHLCHTVYNSPQLDHLLKNKDVYNFDMLIIDLTIIPCMLPLIQEYNIPVVAVSPFMLPPELSTIFGNNLQPAYIPHYFLSATDEMSLFERIKNLFTTYYLEYMRHSYMPKFEQIGRERFGNQLKPYSDLLRKISILICNANPLFDYPQPVPPNIILAGGLHAKPAKPLPKDLQDAMDKSKNGVILFSLGTNVRSDMIGAKNIKILLNTFKRLNETVIWKFESELNDLPKNVFIKKWLPQNDIIAHPNIRLFIGHDGENNLTMFSDVDILATVLHLFHNVVQPHSNTRLFIGHGGALSTQEAFYHGVPIIGIPFFYDQKINVKTLVARKRGLHINIDVMTTDSVFKAIREVLDNPIYRKNVQQVSRRFKDLPRTPLDTAVFWTEYVLKHKDTTFLDPRARNMSIIESTCLDIVLIIIFGITLTILVMWMVVKFVLNRVIKKTENKKKVE